MGIIFRISLKSFNSSIFQLEWPLNYVISSGLIESFNRCLRFLLQLIRASELLSKIRIEC